MTLKIHKKYDTATLITLNYPNCCEQRIVAKIRVWQDFFKTCDRRINGKINVYNCNKDGIGLNFLLVFYGGVEEASQILSPLLSQCRPDDRASFRSFKNSLFDFSMEESSVYNIFKTICDIHPDFEHFKSTGRFLYRDFESDEIKSFIEMLKSKANGCTYSAISLY